jgi:protein O-mannosyl-transferase
MSSLRLNVKRTKNVKFYLAASVALMTFVVYLPALRNGFTVWDDDLYVVANPHIRSLNIEFFKWAFSAFYAGYWSPLTWISHALDYAVWGLNPLGHHLTNIILHAANTFAVVLLIIKLIEAWKGTTKNDVRPKPLTMQTVLIIGGVTGLLFGLHPLHVESVVWVAERKDLLCALFFLLSIIRYTNYVMTLSDGTAEKITCSRLFNKHYLLSAGFFILALLSKPMAVSLPAVLIILDWYPFERIRSFKAFLAAIIEKIPFIVFSFISSLLTILAAKTGEALTPMEFTTLPTRVLVGGRSLIEYMWKIIWPLNLVPFYSYPKNVSILSLEYLSVIVLVIGITALCAVIARRQKLWLAVWGYYIVTLMPVLGIVRVGLQSMADRFVYLPSLGPFLIVGLTAAWIARKVSVPSRRNILMKPLSATVAFVVLVSITYLSMKQIFLWEDDIQLWSYAIDKDPGGAAVSYNNRGTAYGKRGQFDKAIEDLDKAIVLYPDYSDAYSNRGIIYSKVGLLDSAIESFNQAVALKPNAADGYSNRGVAYAMTGQYDKALEDYNRAIASNQNYAVAYYNRGKLFLNTGKKELALTDFQKACTLGYENACQALQE